MANKDNIEISAKVTDKTKDGIRSIDRGIESIGKEAKKSGEALSNEIPKGAKKASQEMESTFGNFTNKLKNSVVPAVVGALKTMFDGLADGINKGFELASKRAENLNAYLNRMDARHQAFLKGGDATVSQIEDQIKNLEKVLAEVNKAKAEVEEIGEGHGFFGRTMRKRNKATSEAISDESKNTLSALGLLGAGNTTQGDLEYINKYIEGLTDEIQHAQKQLKEKLKQEAGEMEVLPSEKDVQAEATKKAEEAWAAYKERLGILAAQEDADSIVAKMFGSKKYGAAPSSMETDEPEAVPQMSAEEVAEFEKEYNTGKNEDNLKNKWENIDKNVQQYGQAASQLANITADAITSMFDRELEEIRNNLDAVDERIDKTTEKIEGHSENIANYQTALVDASGADKQRLLDQIAMENEAMAEEEKRLADEQKEKDKLKKAEAEAEYKKKKADAATQIIQSIINTAMAVSSAVAASPTTGGMPFSAIAAALGTAQTAVIAANAAKIKKSYGNGGLLEGPLHSEGGIPVGATGVEVEGGEFVVNRRATAANLPLLMAINGGAGNSRLRYADGGVLNVDTRDYVNYQPVVSVVDINRVQEQMVRVADMAR